MKRIFAAFIIVIVLFIPLIWNKPFSVVAYSEGDTLIITTKQCNIYEGAGETTTIKATLNYGEKLVLVNTELIEGEHFDFYHITITKEGVIYTGYVISTFVMNSENVALTKKLDANAKTLYNDTIIYTGESEENQLEINGEVVKLEQYQDVKILDGYDKNKTLHKIMFEVDGNIYTGYIKTSDLLVEGFNATIILIVFIFILVASIALSIFLTTRKKRKGKGKLKKLKVQKNIDIQK